VFAGAQDNTVQRWDLTSGKQVAFAGHDSWVRAIAFHQPSDKLITGGYDGNLIWWSAAADEPKPEKTVSAHSGWIRTVRVSPDGAVVASCGNDNLIKLWSAADGSPIRELRGHANHVYNICFHPSGGALASVDLKGMVKHWDLADGKELRQIAAPDLHAYDKTFGADIGGARGLEFSADGKLLAAGGITNVSNAFAGIGNPAVVLFDWEKGEKKQLHKPKENYQASCWGLNFHSAGFVVAVAGGGGGGFLLFFKPDAANEFFQFKLPNTGRDMHLAPDGLRVAVAHHDQHVRIYELRAKA